MLHQSGAIPRVNSFAHKLLCTALFMDLLSTSSLVLVIIPKTVFGSTNLLAFCLIFYLEHISLAPTLSIFQGQIPVSDVGT